MPIYRTVKQSPSGEFLYNDYKTISALLDDYHQIGVEEDSYAMRLHGEPIIRGMVGPLADGKGVVRYECPEAYAVLTEQWSKTKRPRKTPTSLVSVDQSPKAGGMLLIDVGNSRIKLVVADHHHWLARHSLDYPTGQTTTNDQSGAGNCAHSSHHFALAFK